ncbi:hypothetical protein [Spirosoma utsteinense]|uniref:Curli assembly protein CsgC n=1 Tax=Spirosoma utsteinense TaxID=2585773 RepID=A0ABR6W668_9BACT|nr:hypothetical protein [Spirosoma utsteinense]MBC3785909.1 hypothetical protein [Spirosoma utsteinense]MBC3792081.1 hypothetical protein [Spirosoma utsteinense]
MNSISTIILALCLFTSTYFQPPGKVTLQLKNNGRLPREFKFLERHPTDRYPNVFTALILPGNAYKVDVKIGTTLSLVNQQEINATMQGQEAPGKLLLVVKADDDGKTISLVR